MYDPASMELIQKPDYCNRTDICPITAQTGLIHKNPGHFNRTDMTIIKLIQIHKTIILETRL